MVLIVVRVIGILGGEEAHKEDQGNDKGADHNRAIRDPEAMGQPKSAKCSRHRNRERHKETK
jgi:hypothetical protein